MSMQGGDLTMNLGPFKSIRNQIMNNRDYDMRMLSLNLALDFSALSGMKFVLMPKIALSDVWHF